MSGKENQVSAPEYSATTIDMSQPPPLQEAGFNPAVFPTPPPYYETGMQPQPVIVSQVITVSHLQDRPGQAICPSCKQQGMTNIEYKSGNLTILLCVLLFFFGCLIGCCLIPLCVNSCKDVTHYCPNCKNPIYTHKRI